MRKKRKEGFLAFAELLAEETAAFGNLRKSLRYRTAIRSLRRYLDGRKDLGWRKFNDQLIAGYETYLRRTGLCPNTTSFYMRTLRSIFNVAASRGLTRTSSPFSRVYTGIDCTRKRAIDIDALHLIHRIPLDDAPGIDFARDMFIFSFCTRGMPFIDIAYLRRSNLREGKIVYLRHKTGQPLAVAIEPVVKKIIDKYNDPASPWLFPVFTGCGAGEREMLARYNSVYHRVRRNLERLRLRLGLDTKITTYVARHSWASIARKIDIPVGVISEALGHDSESTTRIYLATLDTARIDRANHLITSLLQ